jgi:hypothetical protein
MWQVWGRGEVRKGIWWVNLGEKDHLEDLGVDGRVMLECILKKSGRNVWTGLIFVRKGTSGGLW